MLEEPPKRQTKGSDPRVYHVVTCSAHSSVSFEQNKRRILQFLEENGDINLANLAYTTTARRNHHTLRTAYCVASTKDLTDALTRDLDGVGHQLSNLDKKTPIVFVFSGQGGH